MESTRPRLRLYSLPCLVLKEVFQEMEIQEKFYLSLCSTSSKNIITFFSKSDHPCQVSFRFREDAFEFSLKTKGSQFSPSQDQQLSIMKSLRLLRTSKKPTTGVTRFENDAKNLLGYVSEVFHKPSLKLRAFNRKHPFFKGFLRKTKDLGLEMSRPSVSCSRSGDEVVQTTLDYCTSAKEVLIDCQTTTRSCYQPKKFDKPGSALALDSLQIKHSEWVTTWHLLNLSMNFKRVTLLDCRSKNRELGVFIKKWIESKSPMEHAELQCFDQSLPMTEALKNVKYTVIPRVQVSGQYYKRAYGIEQSDW